MQRERSPYLAGDLGTAEIVFIRGVLVGKGSNLAGVSLSGSFCDGPLSVKFLLHQCYSVVMCL